MASTFRREVKVALAKKGMTSTWLAARISEETGKYMDVSYLNKILDGQHKSDGVIPIVCEKLGIKEPKTM